MSTGVVPQPPPPASGTSPSSAAPSGAPAASPPSTPPAAPEWRVPDTDPRVWARGKTAPQLLDLTDQTVRALEQVVQTGQPAPAAAPAQNGASPTNNGFTEGEYVRGEDLNRMAPKMVADAVDSRVASLNEQLAAIALDQVKREYPSDFERYGPQIYGQLSRLNKAQGAWTVDNVRTVVRLVRADHVDEIVRDKLNATTTGEPALRSTGAAPVSVTPAVTDFSVKSEQLPAEFREKLAKANITDAVMQEFCRVNNMTVEDYFKMVNRGQIITEAPRK